MLQQRMVNKNGRCKYSHYSARTSSVLDSPALCTIIGLEHLLLVTGANMLVEVHQGFREGFLQINCHGNEIT